MRAARALLAVAGLSLVTGGCIRATIDPAKDQSKLGLVVDGVGKVDATPDVLVVSMGVEVRRPTPQAALEVASKRARGLLRAVKAQRVKDADLRTESLNLYPSYGRRGAVVGYTASQSFRVKIRDIKKAGAIVGAAVKGAGTAARVNSMRLEVAEPDRVRGEARMKAIADAQSKASAVARRAGVRLGEPISIQESGGPERTFEETGAFGLTASPGLGSAAQVANVFPQIEVGSAEIVVRVKIRYALAG